MFGSGAQVDQISYLFAGRSSNALMHVDGSDERRLRKVGAVLYLQISELERVLRGWLQLVAGVGGPTV